MNSPELRVRQVFIVGMNGSGTTLLLDCLAGHSQLYGFRGETKVLPYFIEHEADYGDLADDVNFRRLWLDLRASFGRHKWPDRAEPSAIGSWGPRPRSAAAAFDAIMVALASAEGKAIWCEKTPMHVHHIGVLAEAFPNSMFVHVIRDGRDCAASFHRRWKFNPMRTAYRWKQAVRAGREGGALLGARYHEVRYEALTAEPESALRALCGFLDVPFEGSILRPARLRPRMTGSGSAEIAKNERRADGYFDSGTMKRIERIAGHQLEECGYTVTHPAGDLDPAAWKLRLWELADDGRRFVAALLRAAEVPASERVKFLTRRVKGAVKQKRTLG